MRLTVRILNPFWHARDRYAAGVLQEYTDYTGEIIPNYPWLDDNWFVLQENNGDTRILHKDNIVCGWTAPSNEHVHARRYVSIPGKAGRFYTVSLSADGLRFSCNCTGYSYRRTCSHVQELEAA